jgi:hypothetical protein
MSGLVVLCEQSVRVAVDQQNASYLIQVEVLQRAGRVDQLWTRCRASTAAKLTIFVESVRRVVAERA